MILDASAIVALVFQEPGWETLRDKLAAANWVGIGAPTLVETAIVLSARLRNDARGLLARFLQTAGVEVIPFGDQHYEAAIDAWLRYGKGRHPAALNLGDCHAYAVAQLAGEGLLCTGDDFAKTDLALA